MKTKLIQIGNSRGVRIPKALIEQAGLNGAIEMEARDGEIVLRARHHPRAGWDEAMRKAVQKHGNELSQEDLDWLGFSNEFDEKEWTW